MKNMNIKYKYKLFFTFELIKGSFTKLYFQSLLHKVFFNLFIIKITYSNILIFGDLI